ncbi:unnamed protein product, partial [marine sediment metagenome]
MSFTSVAPADYDVRLDLKNVSGQVKADWPVILRVYTVLGRNLPAGSVDPEGFHVYDPAGKEVPHATEKLPPYDQPGNDELVFVIPRIKPGEVLSYRITNTGKKSTKRTTIDVVGSTHNLIGNGRFDPVKDGWMFPLAARDEKVGHSGRSSLRLTADGKTVSTKYARPV